MDLSTVFFIVAAVVAGVAAFVRTSVLLAVAVAFLALGHVGL